MSEGNESYCRPVVYISGPITKGDQDHNFKQADDAMKRLMLAEYSVINPMLSMKSAHAWEIPHDTWIENNLSIILRCDAVLRLHGESAGADAEVAFAKRHEIQVYHDVSAFEFGVPKCRWIPRFSDDSEPVKQDSSRNILAEADQLTMGDRQRDYDHPLPNHRRIADLWNAYMGVRKCTDGPIEPEDVAYMMALLKIARDMHRPKRDNLVDCCGYLRCIERMRAKRGDVEYVA